MEPKLFYILVTAVIGIITTFVTIILNTRQSKQIELLKNSLEQKKDIDTQKFKFLFELHTEKILDYLNHCEKYVKTIQGIKSEIKEILKDNEHIPNYTDQLKDLKKKINSEYTDSSFAFNKIDKSGKAHSIKNDIIDLVDKLYKNESVDFNQIMDIDLVKISIKQKEFQIEVEKEMEKLINNLNIKS
jgi:hypothetical protein